MPRCPASRCVTQPLRRRRSKQKDVAAVRALLKQRADVNATEGDGATALHWAAYHDDVEIVEPA